MLIRPSIVVFSILAFTSQQGLALAAQGAEFDYPELAVTPRASERIEMEAAKEQERRWSTHLPIQFSALSSMVAGVMQLADQNSDPGKDSLEAGIVGVSAGAGWILLTSLMALHYEPYSTAQKELAAMPKKSQREQLLRERIAEERLQSAARVAKRMKWLSVATSIGSGVYMVANANAGSAAKAAAGVTIASALVPMIFPYTWEQVARDQRDYKKKIYAPIAHATVMPEPATGAAAPGLVLTFLF